MNGSLLRFQTDRQTASKFAPFLCHYLFLLKIMKSTACDNGGSSNGAGKTSGEQSGRYSFRKRKSVNKYDKSFLGRDGLSDDEDALSDDCQDSNNNGKFDYIRQPSVLIENIEGVAGSDVFIFRTPKRKDQMYNKAVDSAKKVESIKPVVCKSAEINTPEHVNDVRKSSRKIKPNRKFGEETETPQRARTRTRRQLAKRTESVLSSDDSSDESEASTDNDDDNKVEEEDDSPRAANLIEEYFLAHGSSKITTSDHTLASLDQPKLNQETLQEKLKGLPHKHDSQKKRLLRKHQSFFQKWEYLIANGYNILLFGLGSKHGLLDEFRENYLSRLDCIVINGYFPNITIKQVLSTITEDILGCSKGFSSVTEQLEFIKESYGVPKTSLHIVVHSIDGTTLRRNEDQHVLSVLASLANVHMLASVDHLNCSLMWDQTKSHLFSWLWFDVTNFEPYCKETSYENSLLVQHSGQLALSSLSHVFRSLTSNAQGIFMLLAKYQLEDKESSANYIGGYY